MRILTSIVFIFCGLSSWAQSYIDYQRTFNHMDEDVLIQNYPDALINLDSIYDRYDFIYAKHCVKALQVCCSMNDSIRAKKWLAKCFVQGVPMWIITNNEVTVRVLKYSTTQSVISAFDSLHAVYEASIDMDLANQMEALIVIDQKHTRRVNDGFVLLRPTLYHFLWKRNNKKQFKILLPIIEKQGFPGERLVGLPASYNDSTQGIENLLFYGPVLKESRAYIMLIHYYSTPRNNINAQLLNNVDLGFLPAEQYGAINDFMALWGKHKHSVPKYYNVWHNDPEEDHLEVINERRDLIGLNIFQVQESNRRLWTERRMDKTANAVIILE